jgi:RNA polymerase sigma factor (sigma-70 family)
MSKPKTLADDDISFHIDRVRIGRRPGSTAKQKKAAVVSREILAESYMPLAVNLAEKFVHKLGRDEARSASYYGLALAIRSWNPDKGALPSWIRLYCKNALIREVDKQNIIKLPQEVAPKKAMVNHLRSQGLDDDAITAKLNISDTKLKDLDTLPSTVSWIDSVDTGTDDDNVVLTNLLSQLSNTAKEVIELRFGIGNDGLCLNYEEISKLINVPAKTVQLIEAKALAKLKSIA